MFEKSMTSKNANWFFLIVSSLFLGGILYRVGAGTANYFDGIMTLLWLSNIIFAVTSLKKYYDAK